MKCARLLLSLALLSACGTKKGGAPGESRGFTCSESEITSNSQSPLGSNLGEWGFFDVGQWLAVDQMSKSSEWLVGATGVTYSGTTDASGWPQQLEEGQLPYKILFHQIEGRYPAGTYVIRWEGTGGYPQVYADASNLRCEDGGAISSCSSRRGLFDVDSPTDNGIYLSLNSDDIAGYNATNYLHSIRVIMPGGVCGRSTTDLDPTEYCSNSRGGSGTCDAGESCYDFDDVHWNRFSDPTSEMHSPKIVFHPETLRRLAKYRAIRFMAALSIVGSTVSAWADRSEVTDDTFSASSGVPPEYVFALGNVLATDIWVSLPHLGTDDYFTQFATLALSQFRTDRRIYIEYTNEHWNTDAEYTQSDHMLEQATALGLGVGQTDYVRGALYYATRAKEIFDIWDGVFAGQTSRLYRVLGTGVVDTSITSAFFDVSGIQGLVDGVALGWYGGTYLAFDETASMLEQFSLDDLFRAFLLGGVTNDEGANGAISELSTYISRHKPILDQYGVDMLAYEMGQHLAPLQNVESNTTVMNLFRRANRDARMFDFYRDMFSLWQSSGGKLGNHFQNIEPWTFATFGAMEYQDSSPSDYPKYCSILQFVRTTVCWWEGCGL